MHSTSLIYLSEQALLYFIFEFYECTRCQPFLNIYIQAWYSIDS